MTDTTVLDFNDTNFQAEVLDFKGVVLVDFWATWCPPCKVMSPRIEELHTKYLVNPHVKIGQLDVDVSNQTSFKYKVLSIPTFKIFVNGNIFNEVVGAAPIAKIEDIIIGIYLVL
jgi:thioredoxin 1